MKAITAIGVLLVVLVWYVPVRAAIPVAQNIVASTLYREAGMDGVKGMKAVASVIFNRGRGLASSYASVATKPHQFCCWNGKMFGDWYAHPCTEPQALKITHALFNGTFDPGGPWTMFYNPAIALPVWNKQLRHRVKIGRQVFGVAG